MENKVKIDRENLFYGMSTMLNILEEDSYEYKAQIDMHCEDSDIYDNNEWVILSNRNLVLLCNDSPILRHSALATVVNGVDGKTLSTKDNLDKYMNYEEAKELIEPLASTKPYLYDFLDELARLSEENENINKDDIIHIIREYINSIDDLEKRGVYLDTLVRKLIDKR